jgi:hypothetical protein
MQQEGEGILEGGREQATLLWTSLLHDNHGDAMSRNLARDYARADRWTRLAYSEPVISMPVRNVVKADRETLFSPR